jgi:hypothetical protein
LRHAFNREQALATFRRGSQGLLPLQNREQEMTIEQIIGFGLLAQLSIATILYSMGYRAGKSVGYTHGRSVGIALGKTKAVK